MADEVVVTTTKQRYEPVPKDESVLPPLPWNYAKLCEKYGPEGGEEMYRRVATQPMPDGRPKYFDPRSEPTIYRPDLAP